MNIPRHRSRFVRVCDQWRIELGLNHTDWLRYIGRVDAIGQLPAQTEWSSLRAGRRMPPASFARLVRSKAAAEHPEWLPVLSDAFFADLDARAARAAA